jgi:hypothetical protein
VGTVLFASQAMLHAGSKLDQPHPTPFRVSDSPSRNDCWMLELFDQVARQANVPIGFENRHGCWFAPRSIVHDTDARTLRAQTARQAFDEVAAISGMFVWQEIDGVAVIRPADAWPDPNNILNLPTDSIHLVNVTADDALYHALDATLLVHYRRPKVVQTYRLLDLRMTIDFAGGTLLRALNTIVRAKGDAEWRIAYGNDGAAILIGSLSTLQGSQSALVRSITWNPRAAAAFAP